MTYKQLLTDPALRQPLMIAIVMMSQQISGINAAVYFSSHIFRTARLSDEAALYATLGIGITIVLTTITSLVLVEKVGRRTLHLLGLSGMATMSVALVLCLFLLDNVPILRYLSIVSVYMFVIAFAIGPGSIPWFIVGEMFDSGAIGVASSQLVF